jgi:hypothetical protein
MTLKQNHQSNTFGRFSSPIKAVKKLVFFQEKNPQIPQTFSLPY